MRSIAKQRRCDFSSHRAKENPPCKCSNKLKPYLRYSRAMSSAAGIDFASAGVMDSASEGPLKSMKSASATIETFSNTAAFWKIQRCATPNATECAESVLRPDSSGNARASSIGANIRASTSRPGSQIPQIPLITDLYARNTWRHFRNIKVAQSKADRS